MVDYLKLRDAMGDLDEAAAMEQIEIILNTPDVDVDEAVKACQEGLNIVGDRFETGEYFVGDLIYSGDLMGEIFAKLKPLMGESSEGRLGKMVICTVEGDLHDIGKNIVKVMLETAGFNVIDLGIDTPVETVVNTMKESGCKILAMSGVLTLAIDSMKRTVDALAEAGMRDDIHVIIGGAPVTAEYAKYVKCDAWTLNAAETVRICREWAS